MIKEYLLTTNEFSKPKDVSGSKAVSILLLRLLIMYPGVNPLHPKMGVGLYKYRYITEDDISILRNEIENQINTYMPEEYQNSEVILKFKEKNILVISIVINNIAYVFDTEESKHPITLSSIIK